MKNIFEGLEVYRITYGDYPEILYEGGTYATLDEAKADLLKFAQEDKENGNEWWKCTFRRIEKYNSDCGNIWDDEAWFKVWGEDDFAEIFPKFGDDD